eukprot:scaffold171903_cov25-Tisochrysis_lutea.AAC.2
MGDVVLTHDSMLTAIATVIAPAGTHGNHPHGAQADKYGRVHRDRSSDDGASATRTEDARRRHAHASHTHGHAHKPLTSHNERDD